MATPSARKKQTGPMSGPDIYVQLLFLDTPCATHSLEWAPPQSMGGNVPNNGTLKQGIDPDDSIPGMGFFPQPMDGS